MLKSAASRIIPVDLNDPSLVLYLPLWYPAEDMTGSTVYSYDKNRLSCTVSGSTWSAEGRYFDSVDDYIEVTHNANQLLTSGGTIILLVRPDSYGENNQGIIISKGEADWSDGYHIRVGNLNEVYMVTGAAPGGGTNVASGDGTVPCFTETWSHIVCTLAADGTTTFYINCNEAGSGASADPSGITSVNAIRIGNRSTDTDRTFEGHINEVMIYDRIFTASEAANACDAASWRVKIG